MTTGEQRNRIDEALLLSQSLCCSDMAVGLMVAGCLDPQEAPINPMLTEFLNKYAKVVIGMLYDSYSRHRSNPPFGPLINVATLCLAAKKCSESKAILPLTNHEEYEVEGSVIKYLCEVDPFVASLAITPIDNMLRTRAANARMAAILHRLKFISHRFVNDHPQLFQANDRVDSTKISARFQAEMTTNICALLQDPTLSMLGKDIVGVSRATIKLLYSYYTVVTGKVPEGDVSGQYIMLKMANTETDMYEILGKLKNVAEFKHMVYGLPYTKKHIQLSSNALFGTLQRTFKPHNMDFVAEYCAYMHLHHMVEYPSNTMLEGWYKTDGRAHNMHSQVWYSMALFVAAVYKDYKPLLAWLEKYQYKKVQKGWNMDVMRAKFKASEVLGLGIDVKQQKVGKGVLYNFLKEGMVGPLVTNT